MRYQADVLAALRSSEVCCNSVYQSSRSSKFFSSAYLSSRRPCVRSCASMTWSSTTHRARAVRLTAEPQVGHSIVTDLLSSLKDHSLMQAKQYLLAHNGNYNSKHREGLANEKLRAVRSKNYAVQRLYYTTCSQSAYPWPQSRLALMAIVSMQMWHSMRSNTSLAAAAAFGSAFTAAGRGGGGGGGG
jgi:hypothetical protein